MRRDALVDALARGAGPWPRAAVMRRLGPASAMALGAAAALALATLGPIPAALWAEPAPWAKLAYAGGLLGTAAWAASRLARAGREPGAAPLALVLVLAAIALAAAQEFFAAPPEARAALLLGSSALRCPFVILALSLPGLAGLLLALRRLSPTRLAAAGLAAGLTAGAAGYALACTELALPFVAIWYTAGIALSGALGAALGPRALRW